MRSPLRPVHALAVCLAISVAAPVQAVELHCLGHSPGFMLVLQDQRATLDYLGDGVFDLHTPLPDPVPPFFQTALETAGGPVPVYLERASCEIFGISLPFRVELGIPAFAGQAPAFGCCRQADPAE